MALPFLLKYPKEYLGKAFELSRVFEYKWTVNWKFISESVFLSQDFSRSLTLTYLLVLFFFLYFKWSKRRLFHILYYAISDPLRKGNFGLTLSDSDIVSILFTGQFIGICFARSLHYQFYSWYFWTLPYLFWTAIDGISKHYKKE